MSRPFSATANVRRRRVKEIEFSIYVLATLFAGCGVSLLWDALRAIA